MSELDHYWDCPSCQTINLDNYELTAIPSCSECFNSFLWDEIVDPNKMKRLNDKLTEGE